ncbi:hypothetical protein M011DRAFT_466857 [Sporormia fimetaria CBS 119925]|uniref:Zn(2)-C6 fungal-type domain-containing protein n=1 Tax=Sporormia fimetaria CBS 119925 TaxID=1340428 RepID=A0A6A6VE22_9PLEO|nr:hypothetical protein M011DRAFT_466857 [Sporormia fimetaria CBS 119925]
MTRLGKCDICRSRKVKCDEIKPVCGACVKKNRPCAYSYGQTTDDVYNAGTSTPTQPDSATPRAQDPARCFSTDHQGRLQVTSTRKAGKGHGAFHVLTLMSRSKKGERSRQAAAQDIQQEALSRASLSPSSLDYNALGARLHHIFGLHTPNSDARSFHGTWTEAVLRRLGSSALLDSAAEYALKTVEAYRSPTFSAERAALFSRSRALQSLRERVERYHGEPSHDLVLAAKLHQFAEVYMDVGKYATHCLGLSELLKMGAAVGLDEEYHFSLVHNTYFDEAAEAFLTGRPSIYDTTHYLSLTDPLTFRPGPLRLFETQMESVATMHCLVQLPRLACFIRRSLTKPGDIHTLKLALSLAKHLWALDPSSIIDLLVQTSATVIPTPPAPEIEDIVPCTFAYDSLQAMLVCTRYWSLHIHLCALIQTMWNHFPDECTDSSLPSPDVVQNDEIQAATYIIQSLPFATSFSDSIPLVPLRVLAPLALSVGSWYRLLRRHTNELASLSLGSDRYGDVAKKVEKANRMEECVIEKCNQIHEWWGVGRAERDRFEALIPLMAGAEIPNWMPNRVSWEKARALMVMQGTYVCGSAVEDGVG